MNPFLKAGILTALVVLLAFLMVSQIDNMRANELRKNVESVLAQKQAEDVLAQYSRVLAKSPQEQCPYLLSLRQAQLDRTYSIALRLQDYERSNILNAEYEQLKLSYFLGLSSMYVSGFENRKTCGVEEIPLAFFYKENSLCPDCLSQNAILSNVAKRCKNVRIYAFPADYSLEPVKILADRYKISAVPAIVINDGSAQAGLQSEAALINSLVANGATCQ
ncbi:Uncharacterised protein [Candidatus Anstonella stagnisolia]|nr:Uncharacterised protein [Candidatus Anstonella stagnisolia]